MHLPLSAARQPISDVDVIYFVAPLEENLKAITKDLKDGLYDPAHLNFLWTIPRSLLEMFATDSAEAKTSDKIASLHDQYLNFIVAGAPDLFSLNMQKEHTYKTLNSAKTSDQELDHVVDRIVSGLMSVIVTMGRSWCGFPGPNCLMLMLQRCHADNKVSQGRRCRNALRQA